jgi:hypothetical protein
VKQGELGGVYARESRWRWERSKRGWPVGGVLLGGGRCWAGAGAELAGRVGEQGGASGSELWLARGGS